MVHGALVLGSSDEMKGGVLPTWASLFQLPFGPQRTTIYGATSQNTWATAALNTILVEVDRRESRPLRISWTVVYIKRYWLSNPHSDVLFEETEIRQYAESNRDTREGEENGDSPSRAVKCNPKMLQDRRNSVVKRSPFLCVS